MILTRSPLPLVTSLAVALLFGLESLTIGQTNPATPTLIVDASKITTHVSPTLYGLMTEEINYSYEGGLYGELIQNRIFKDNATEAKHWAVVQDAGGTNAIALDESQPIEGTVLTRSLRLDAGGASPGKRVGIANDGYWGIPVKPKTTYHVSFYAKSKGSSGGPLTLSIECKDGTKVFASAQIPQVTDKWQKYTATLTTGEDVSPSAGNRFVISTDKPDTLWFNLVSLFPPTFNDRPNGNRTDIMQLLSDMKPTFLRLPGGNFLEGDLIADRFPWKQTLGPLEQRPGHKGCWHYGANDGMGLLEFMEWCEDLHIQPVLAVYAGYSLRGEHVEPGPALQPYVQDALDEIEYVTGDVSTKWGAVRAKDGHPAPFPLTYVEIGNEDGFDKSGSYDGRFAQFSDAIKAKYPQLKCIATAGGADPISKRVKLTQRIPDVSDEHYYRNAWEMEEDAAHYDSYNRKGPKIFVGEWATREGKPTTNLNAALGDAAWMTGMERNSDLVVMASYAPLFVNVNPGGMQWPSNLIGYDTLTSYGSPSYYAQKMFNTYLGESVISVVGENIPTQTWQPPTPKAKPDKPAPTPPPAKQVPSLFFVATKNSKTGTIYLKIVNTAGTPQAVQIDLKGATIASEGTLVTLTSQNPEDTNSIKEPKKIVPVTSKVDGLGSSFTKTFAPYSINVLQMEIR